MDATLRRLAPLSGIGFVVCYAVGLAVAMGDSPDFADSPAEIATWYEEEKDSILAGAVISTLGAPLYIWFLGCLRTAIARAEGGPTRLASTAFGAGVASLATGVAGLWITAMGALRVEEDDRIDPATATAFFDIGQVTAFTATAAVVAGLLLATAVAAFRYGAILPKWLAGVTVAIAILNLIPPISFLGIFVGLLWTLVVSGLLYAQRVGESAPGETAGVPRPTAGVPPG